MRITLKHIAERTGISINTVSMALRNMPGIKSETREKVISVANELGYFSNKTNGTTKNICIISTGERLQDSYFYMSFLQAILKKAHECDANMMVYSSSNLNINTDALKLIFTNNSICGIIVLGDTEEDIIGKVADCGLPVIAIGTRYNSLNLCTIIEDNYCGAYQAVSFLRENGYEKLGFMGAPSHSTGFMERYSSTIGVMQSFDMEIDTRYFITDLSFDTQYDFIKVSERLRKNPLPEAFICANDNVGIILIKALDYLGIKVPQDIAVIGFDNSAMGQMANPSLTTIDVMYVNQSELCVDMLMDFIEIGNVTNNRILVPTQLVKGDSVIKKK